MKVLTSFYEYLFKALVFLLPVQLGYHFWPSWSHVFGIRVDYLAPTIYLTDVLVLVLAILSFTSSDFKAKSYSPELKVIIAGLAVFVFLNIVNATFIYPAIFKWLKVGELALFGYIVAAERRLDIKKWILQPLAWSIVLFSAIGIVQFLLGHTIGGQLYFLGERSFNLMTPGISKISFLGSQYLRSYSTFSHPNSFAGFLAVSIFLILPAPEIVPLFLGLVALFLTFSLSAFLAVILGTIFLAVRKIDKRIFAKASIGLFGGVVLLSILSPVIYPIVLSFFNNPPTNLLQRAGLVQSAESMISQKPLFGAGLNNFVAVLPKTGQASNSSWLLQPIHNIFLLVLAETGLVGLLIFSYLIFRSIKNSLITSRWPLVVCLAVVLVTGLADHYWLTLQQNQLLLALILGLSFRKQWTKNY